MKLLRVALKNYKHLKKIDLKIAEPGEKGDFPAYFCIGLNGSGKSAFLEAVALIFSRVSQDELPGFWFKIEYEVLLEGKAVQVSVCPEQKRELGRLHIEIDGEIFHSFQGREDYLPRKVIIYVSGPNSQMRELIGQAARDSIISDIYDARGEESDKIQEYLQHLSRLSRNPRILYLDEETAPYVLFALCTWLPPEPWEYNRLRGEILRKIGEGVRVNAFSLVAKEELESSLVKQLFSAGREKSGLADWVVKEEKGMRAVYKVGAEGGGFCNRRIREAYDDPLRLLTLLLRARADGELQECHFFFKKDAEGEMLGEKALSDGELLWLARMGLVLAASQGDADNCLFLFDEPDVYLNESWNVEFVSGLERLTGKKHNSFWIATHSSLLLTDAPSGQVFLFEKTVDGIKAGKVPISLFAGSRQEISRNVFQNSARMGQYADRRVKEMMQDRNREHLEEYIEQVGSGIWRFKLLEKYYGDTEE